MGNTLFQTQQQVETREVSIDLSAASLKTGLYLLKIIDVNDNRSTIKVIKK